MRRYLVLSSDQAGHPFRRSLPAAVTRTVPWRDPAEDRRLFGMTFLSGFVAILAFLA